MTERAGPALVVRRNPPSLLKLASLSWLNGRWDWDPDLATHLCKTNDTLSNMVFDCDIRTLRYKCNHLNYTGRGESKCKHVHRIATSYVYLTLPEIIHWEETGEYPPFYDKLRERLQEHRWFNRRMGERKHYVVLEDCQPEDRLAERLINCRRRLFRD